MSEHEDFAEKLIGEHLRRIGFELDALTDADLHRDLQLLCCMFAALSEHMQQVEAPPWMVEQIIHGMLDDLLGADLLQELRDRRADLQRQLATAEPGGMGAAVWAALTREGER